MDPNILYGPVVGRQLSNVTNLSCETESENMSMNPLMSNTPSSPPTGLNHIFRYSSSLTIFFILVYSVVFLAGLIGNVLVIFVSLRAPRFRSSVTYLFIMNLAVADLLVILFCVPPTLISNVLIPWVLGKVMCKLVPYVQGVSVCASVYSLVAVSLDRFIAIWYPLGHGLTKGRARLIILLIWASAGCLAAPAILVFDITSEYEPFESYEFCTENWPPSFDGTLYFLFGNMFLCYLFPLSSISLCYLLIWFRVLRRQIPTEDQVHLAKIHEKAKIGVLRMLIVVVFVFLLSWLPLYILFARIKLGSQLDPNELEIFEILTPIAQWLGSSNSSINPILYTFLNVKFRRACWAYIPCLVHRVHDRMMKGQGSRDAGITNTQIGTKSSMVHHRQQTILYNVPITSGV